MRVLFVFLLIISLSFLSYIRTDGFSPSLIRAPLSSSMIEAVVPSVLSQPFHYLARGRQCFVFESEDRTVVLKFFNNSYFSLPWYSCFLPKEKEKREKRKLFYETSYEIAYRELGEEILYLHFNHSTHLPKVQITDKASRTYLVDLNEFPFVIQRKGIPFYDGLKAIYQKEGIIGLNREIDAYLAQVELRISKMIADGDRDIEHNWGYIDGKIFHLDPGRLYYDPTLIEPQRCELEWNRATQSLYKWLRLNVKNHLHFGQRENSQK